MTSSKTRRSFLKAAAATGAAGLTAPAIAQPQVNVRWRLVSSFPKSLDTIYAGGAEVAERVAAVSGGRFQIQAFAAGEIVPAFGVLEAVQGGTVECGHTAMSYFAGKDMTFAFDANLPFGLNARQQNAWFYYGGGMELHREFMKEHNVITLPAGNTGAQMGGWFRKEIKSLEDMRGLKMRVTGASGQVLAKVGTVPQQIPAGDVYTALERGTIDAAEWIGPYDDEKLGLHKVAKYYYYPGWWDSGPQISLIVNLRSWESLSPEYKALLEAACAEANVRMLAKYDARNPPALRRLLAGGAELRPFPNEVNAECYKRAHELYDEIAATNPAFRKIYEPWRQFRSDEVLWWRLAEMPLANIMAAQQGR